MSRKKWGIVCAGVFLLGMLSTSCKEDLDEELLLGKWREGSEYYRYDADRTGVTWDVADDMSEEEALSFTWELTDDHLTHYHQFEVGSAVVPKTYKVTKLTASQLQYSDNVGTVHHFIRTNN